MSAAVGYGMPTYAKDGKVVCFFQSGQKFKSRYATLGFQDAANLDDGDIWPTSFALKKLTTPAHETIGKPVQRDPSRRRTAARAIEFSVSSPSMMAAASRSMSPLRRRKIEVLVAIFTTGVIGEPVGVPRPVVKAAMLEPPATIPTICSMS